MNHQQQPLLSDLSSNVKNLSLSIFQQLPYSELNTEAETMQWPQLSCSSRLSYYGDESVVKVDKYEFDILNLLKMAFSFRFKVYSGH